jgi:hypothetical protein
MAQLAVIVMWRWERPPPRSYVQSDSLGHKMTNDTKGSQFQDARDSGPSSGTRTGRKQVRSCSRGTSPQSGEAGGTRKTSRPRGQAH